MSTFEDSLEDQILRAEMVEALEVEQRADEDALRRARACGDRRGAFWIRMRMRYRKRRMWSLS